MAIKSLCSIPGCSKPLHGATWCQYHYRRHLKHGDPLWEKPPSPKRVQNTCSVDGCDETSEARGYCYWHYRRWRRHGIPTGGRTSNGEPEKFYAIALNFSGQECLIWPFSRNDGDTGYGRIMRDGRLQIVSRLLCQEVNGPPPTQRHQAAHSCGKGIQGCVNPKHLVWKTVRENDKDKDLHGTRCNGVRHHCAKLTPPDVLEIRRLLRTTPVAAIARKYGLAQNAIRSIRDGKSWKSVTSENER